LRYQLTRTQLIIDKIFSKNKTIGLTKDELEKIENDTIKSLQERYPNMGIKKKET
jgi:hypothetical protein